MTRRFDHSLAIYALTPAGAALGARLRDALGGTLHTPVRMAAEHGAVGFRSFRELMADAFGRYRGHVCIAACGIVVRAVAGLLADKTRDPAVVVMDAAGEFAISLLSGHAGGANDLARAAARAVGGRAVITTATDVAGVTAVDELARELGMVLDNPGAVKHVSGALAAGEEVLVFDPAGVLDLGGPDRPGRFAYVGSPLELGDGPQIRADWRTGFVPEKAVVLRPRALHAGVGCRRGVSADEIVELVRGTFAERGWSLHSLAYLASIEAKRDEAGLLEAAATLDVGLRFYSARELAAAQAPHPSELVRKHMGVASVCEAAAMLSAGTGKLALGKRKTARATLAVALAV